MESIEGMEGFQASGLCILEVIFFYKCLVSLLTILVLRKTSLKGN